MYLILALSALLIIGLAVLGVHFVIARQGAKRATKERAVAARLNAVVAQAEEEHQERTAAARASSALTTVLPIILLEEDDRAPRRVA